MNNWTKLNNLFHCRDMSTQNVHGPCCFSMVDDNKRARSLPKGYKESQCEWVKCISNFSLVFDAKPVKMIFGN